MSVKKKQVMEDLNNLVLRQDYLCVSVFKMYVCLCMKTKTVGLYEKLPSKSISFRDDRAALAAFRQATDLRQLEEATIIGGGGTLDFDL